MSRAEALLSNAERLISDAAHMHCEGRSRSAATLIVVALEQLGAFVEALTQEKYPEAVLHIGIFGDRANAHAKRQDALAAHVLNFVLGEQIALCLAEKWYEETKDTHHEDFLRWVQTSMPVSLSSAQQERSKRDPDFIVANTLMQAVRKGELKHLREYGLYEDTEHVFSDASVGDIIELTAKVLKILAKAPVLPETIQIAGINMPKGRVVGPGCQEGCR